MIGFNALLSPCSGLNAMLGATTKYILKPGGGKQNSSLSEYGFLNYGFVCERGDEVFLLLARTQNAGKRPKSCKNRHGRDYDYESFRYCHKQ